MKEIIISVIILILIGTLGIKEQRYIERTGDFLVGELENLKQNIMQKNKNNDIINEHIENIKKDWERTERSWSKIIIHEELDNIKISLISLKSKVENNRNEEALEEIEKAIFWIGHIKERESLKFKNIF